MDPEIVFKICNLSALPGWALLLLAPGWKWTQRISGVLLPLATAVVYLALLVVTFGSESNGDFSSLAGVAGLFENRWGLLAGWVHYIAFDLFIGSWESRDARKHGIHHLAVVPCLCMTLMLGPVGLLAYFTLRTIWKRQLFLDLA